MERKDFVLMGLAFVALTAVVVYRRPLSEAIAPSSPVADGESLTPENTSMAKGPVFLQYNSPWAFAPPVGNFLPNLTVGMGAQTVQLQQQTSYSTCGCDG